MGDGVHELRELRVQALLDARDEALQRKACAERDLVAIDAAIDAANRLERLA